MLVVALVVARRMLVAGPAFRSFSVEVRKFPDELATLINEGGSGSSEDQRLMKEFRAVWESPQLTDAERIRVVEFSNRMLRPAMRSRGYFAQWRDVLTFYLKDPALSSEYELFLKMVDAAITREGLNAVGQLKFLQDTWNLFREGRVHSTLAFAWRVRLDALKVEFKPELHYVFNETDLVCAHAKDSVRIHGTSGVYDPFTHVWKGRGGQVLWERSNYAPERVNAVLADYEVDLTNSHYEADSVTFTNTDYFEHPVKGHLADRLVLDYTPEGILFPVFTSYEKRLDVKNLMEGVKFTGGCIMEGTRLVGIGNVDTPVQFSMLRNGKPFLNVQAERMAFRPSRIEADFARVVIHIDQDSLYHSGLRFEYNDATKQVRIMTTDLLITKAPIYSTYHRMAIYFDELQWKVGEEKMKFGPRRGSNYADAIFLSDNYFDRDGFDTLMGPDEVHPILALANYSKKCQSNTFGIEPFAKYLRRNVKDTRLLLMQMAVQGVLLYDVGRQQVTLLPRLFNQVKARGGRIDYDAINFTSSVGGGEANAMLNLDNADLDVYNVRRVNVSDSQNVKIDPSEGYLRMKRNRNFEFNGHVDVGLLTFAGEGIAFDYENYTIDLKSVQRVDMKYLLKTRDNSGQREQAKVMSSLQNLTGFVHIDNPDNKSGLKKSTDYPRFESTSPSYVYYDKGPDGSGYDRDEFYFQVEPFTFHNLNHFEPNDITFAGTLHSGDIFEPFADTLRLRPDRSLGFVHRTPAEGMPLYDGKGRFHNTIDLSNQGLRGDGELEYLTSRTSSSSFQFYPDSMRAISRSFRIAEDTAHYSFPDVEGTAHGIRWLPSKDKLYAYKGEKPFVMYHEQSNFLGDLLLQPAGLEGNGTVDLTKAKMVSPHFQFSHQSWQADSLATHFLVPGQTAEAFVASNIGGSLDYRTRNGQFWRTGSSIAGDLKPLEYSCHTDRIQWPMDEDILQFVTAEQQKAVQEHVFDPPRMYDRDTVPPGTFFFSTRAGEDSLYFASRWATYKMRSPRLDADSVPYVLVADAVAYPKNGQTVILPQERMLPLDSASLVASVFKRYHRIYDANLSIKSRRRYTGKGFINYVDELDSVQVIKLDSIYIADPHKGGATQAFGYVAGNSNFTLSPYFAFEGRVTVDANEPNFYFSGGATPLYSCTQMKADRLFFKGRLQADSLYIPLTHPQRDINDGWLVSGTVVAYDSTHLYPAFSTQRYSFLDGELSRPKGYMMYHKRTGRFVMADSILFQYTDSVRQRIELDPQTCRLFTQGLITMPYDLGRVTTHATGSVIHDLNDSTASLRLFLDFNFHFSADALKHMARDFASRESLPKLDQAQDVFLMGLRERLPYARYERAKQQIELFGEVNEPITEIIDPLVFTDLQMTWDQANRSFVSVGRLGLGFIGGQYIGRKVNGFLEIVKRVSGDTFTLYLEPEPGTYYLFTLSGISLYVASSDQDFLKIISKTSKKNRRLAPKGKLPKYIYDVGTTTDTYNAQVRYRQLQKRWQ